MTTEGLCATICHDDLTCLPTQIAKPQVIQIHVIYLNEATYSMRSYKYKPLATYKSIGEIPIYRESMSDFAKRLFSTLYTILHGARQLLSQL